MSQFLMVDIGAGTMDVLCYESEADLHYKAVVKSPVRSIAEKAAAIPGNLIVTGCEMGGGKLMEMLFTESDLKRERKMRISAETFNTYLTTIWRE